MKAAFEAYNRGDLDAWLADADPDAEWHVLPEATDPGPHRGRQVILERGKLWRQMLAAFGPRFWSTSTRATTSSRRFACEGRPRKRCRGGSGRGVCVQAPQRQDRRTSRISDQGGGPRSRRAAGVGDVAGERRGGIRSSARLISYKRCSCTGAGRRCHAPCSRRRRSRRGRPRCRGRCFARPGSWSASSSGSRCRSRRLPPPGDVAPSGGCGRPSY